ncbi:MAG: polysaccharide biosynthesis/export family protein [Bdellovibrionota bacterium]
MMGCVYFLVSTTAWAIDLDQGFSGPSSSEAEYFNINHDKRMTIQVNFLGGVQRPGIHHIPDNLHLLEAISLAGGVTSDADAGKVYIKRKSKDKQFQTLSYDLGSILSDDSAQYPELRNNDTILIDTKSHAADKLLVALSILGSMVAITTGYLIITKKR